MRDDCACAVRGAVAFLYQREGCRSVIEKARNRWPSSNGWTETPVFAALATQPATSQAVPDSDWAGDWQGDTPSNRTADLARGRQPATSQEGELRTNDLGLGNDWFGDQDRAATPTPPTLSEDLRAALKSFAAVAQGEVWERFIADSKMNLRISNGSGSAHYCFINAECFEAARAALARAQGQAS